MTDLGKLLREKLGAAKDDLVDASTYTIGPGSVVSVGSGEVRNYMWSGNVPSYSKPMHVVLEETRAEIKQLDYILQRIVPNYDELVAQYKAVRDIEEAGK